jgi:alpha-galactosidase
MSHSEHRVRGLVVGIAASCCGALDNGMGLLPPMGYSSWNDCVSEITEARIKSMTRALIDTGLAAKGYVHVNVDEGWFKERSESGAMVEDFVKFPSGMRALGEWIHDQDVPGKGKVMKFGLYTCRGTCQCGTELYPEAPGSKDHEAQDSQWMVDAGADYVKEDSCCGSEDHDVAFAEYGKMRDGLNATGRRVYFSLCGWEPWYAPVGASLGNSWRIAADGKNWDALSQCVNKNAYLGQYAKPGAWNDPDLLIGTGVGSNDLATNPEGCYDASLINQTNHMYQTDEQSRTQFSMWAVMSAPLLISANLNQVSEYALETWGNEEVISVSQHYRAGGPYQGVRVMGGNISFDKVKNTGEGANVWAKPLPDGEWALAFLNNWPESRNVTCGAPCFESLSDIGVASGSYIIRDLWLHEDVTVRQLGPEAELAFVVQPLGGVRLFRLTPSATSAVIAVVL